MTTRPVDSGPAPSSRRRWCWSSCCGSTRARATRARSRWSRPRATRWHAAASTTSSAGGFARYGVDRFWRVPHFEKMLYDNAQLLRDLPAPVARDRFALAERVARETARFMVDELGTAEGGFASALDADSDGARGHVLRLEPEPAHARPGCAGRRVGGDPPRRHGRREPSSAGSPRSSCSKTPTTPIAGPTSALACSRPGPSAPDRHATTRWWPRGTDSAITALAEASVLLDDPSLGDAAVAAATLLADVHGAGESTTFVRASRDGVAGRHAAVLEDHGCVAEAFVAVLGITGDPVWLDRARVLLDARARALRGTGRWVLRHRGRRRGARGSAAGRLRQRLAVRHVVRRGGTGGVRRCHRRAPISRGSRGRTRIGRRDRSSGTSLRRLEPRRRRGDAGRPGRGRRRRADGRSGTTCTAPPSG